MATLGPLGLGNTMKLVNSLVAFTTTWASLEGLSLAAKSGIPVQHAVEVLRTNGVANFYLDRMVDGIDERDRPTQFALELAAKDAGLIVETGRALGVPTPAGGAVLQVLVGAIAAGLGDRDWSDLVDRGRAAGRRRAAVERRMTRPPPEHPSPGTRRCTSTDGCVGSVGRAEHVGRDAQRGDGRGDARVDRDLHEHLDQLVA